MSTHTFTVTSLRYGVEIKTEFISLAHAIDSARYNIEFNTSCPIEITRSDGKVIWRRADGSLYKLID